VMTLTDQVLEILGAAHQKGIVHRDIKPENLFLHRGVQVKLLDFGIARLREADSDTKKTVEGAVMGTPAFMAPEQARGVWSEVDAQSDLWSLGATMFALLTGEVVHKGATVNEALAASITQPARPVRDLSPEIHPRLAEVVDRALAREKIERYGDAGAMRLALRQAFFESQGVELVSAPGPAFGDGRQSHPSLLGQHQSYPNPSARASAASYGDITGAGTSPPVTATHTFQHGRSKAPLLLGLAALLGLGVVAAGGVGVYVYTQRPGDAALTTQQPPGATLNAKTGDAPTGEQPAKASSDEPPTVAPADEASDAPEDEEASPASSAAAASGQPIKQAKAPRRVVPKPVPASIPAKKAAAAPAPAAKPPEPEPAPVAKPAPKKEFDPFAARD